MLDVLPHAFCWLNACWHRTLRQVLVLLLLATCLPAWALEDFVLKRSFVVDTDGRMTIEEVHSHEGFQPIAGPLARGYTASVTWLRLEVAATPRGQLALVIQPSYLDDLRLYSPKRFEPGWIVQQAGDRFAHSARETPEINVSFRVYSEATEPSVHYLRLQTSSASLIHVRAMGLSDTMAFDTLLHVAIGIYVGLIFVLLCFALICWGITRDALWGFDSALQTSTLLFTCFNMGFAGKYLFSNQPAAADLGVSTITCMQVAIAGLFFWRLFKAYNAPGWTTLLYRFSLLLLPVMLLLIALGMPQSAVWLNANLLLLQTLLGVVIIWFVRIPDAIQRHMLRFTYLALIIYLIFYTLPLVGLAEATEFNLYPALLGNLFTSVMLQLVLARRTQLQLSERWQLQLQMADTGEKLKWETERREEATTFLSMLLHELKNPLASIRMATQSLISGRIREPADQTGRLSAIQASVADIDAVLERCVDADRLEQGVFAVHKENHDVAALLVEWVAAEPLSARIRFESPGRMAAKVDAPLLCMMVRNLISNALTYSPEDSEVVVTLSERKASSGAHPVDGFLVEVRNPIGRAGAPDPAYVFEKYYRAPNAHHVTGTGLGLYWVRSAVRLLDGWVTYRHGGQPLGTHVVFELWLPR